MAEIYNPTLYDRIGGEKMVNLLVDVFYYKVLADDRVSRFFTEIDMLAQKRKQRAFLTFVFGGADAYTGQSLRRAHARLVEQGMDVAHFFIVLKHLQDSLTELGVEESLVNEVVSIANSTRHDVMGE